VDSWGNGRPIPGRWTRYRIKLDSTGDWNLVRGDGHSAKATDEDIKRVLSDVTELWIKGEYYGHGEDTGDLDDVVFGAEPSELEMPATSSREQIAASRAASPIEPAKTADRLADRRGRAVNMLNESLAALKHLSFSRNPDRARTRDRSVAAIQEVIKQVEKGLFPIQRLQGVREDLAGVQRVAVVGTNKNLLSSVDSWLAQTMEILTTASPPRGAGESRTEFGVDPASVQRGEASKKE
jgi:hypothetical protein